MTIMLCSQIHGIKVSKFKPFVYKIFGNWQHAPPNVNIKTRKCHTKQHDDSSFLLLKESRVVWTFTHTTNPINDLPVSRKQQLSCFSITCVRFACFPKAWLLCGQEAAGKTWIWCMHTLLTIKPKLQTLNSTPYTPNTDK